MSEKQIELVNIIDKNLEVLLNKLEYEEYINFIKSNKSLSFYDDILGFVDIEYIDKKNLELLTEDLLNEVNEIVLNKINESEVEVI